MVNSRVDFVWGGPAVSNTAGQHGGPMGVASNVVGKRSGGRNGEEGSEVRVRGARANRFKQQQDASGAASCPASPPARAVGQAKE